MKTLLLIRHAKSCWEDAGLSDFDRPLNDRGKKDAPEMAHRLLHNKFHPDAFLGSPARRAAKTASIMAKEMGLHKKQLIWDKDLYLAPASVIMDAVRKIPPEISTLAVVAHNPGITELVNQLTDARVDNMPTCSVFVVGSDVSEWNQFPESEKKFLFFDFPKNKNT